MFSLIEKEIERNDELASIIKSTGKIKFVGRFGQRIDLLWTSKAPLQQYKNVDITVDVMPAIVCSYNQIEKYLQQLQFPEKQIPLLKEESCYLVPKSCSRRGCRECFRLSFATCELKLMQGLDNVHRSCYKILKKVFSLARTHPHPREYTNCLLYTSPSPRDATLSRMPSSA